MTFKIGLGGPQRARPSFALHELDGSSFRHGFAPVLLLGTSQTGGQTEPHYLSSNDCCRSHETTLPHFAHDGKTRVWIRVWTAGRAIPPRRDGVKLATFHVAAALQIC
jgi:hypothetical protein